MCLPVHQGSVRVCGPFFIVSKKTNDLTHFGHTGPFCVTKNGQMYSNSSVVPTLLKVQFY